MTNSDKLPGFIDKIEKEFQSQELKATKVPTWLNGILLRQVCGGFGQFETSTGSHIEHFNDCMGSVVQFQFQSGNLFYSHK